jgi:hypothetical protein
MFTADGGDGVTSTAADGKLCSEEQLGLCRLSLITPFDGCAGLEPG